jgi:surface carbohydrate biosynthesis protein
LIVDNPLRDLEGLVLLGRQLSSRGAKVTLVPMYEQGFDIPALKPDMVLVNYTRPNNADLLRSYKGAGILVGVLDTEGIAGKSSDQFAEMVKGAGCTELVDLYCVWGLDQEAAFARHRTVDESVLRATGCPRYDFCAPQWRSALPAPPVRPGYVLINTNFPTVNPRFSTGEAHEENSMVQAGFARDFARQFIADGRLAYRAMLDTSVRLAKHFSSVTFVLRPHPFESLASYEGFAELPNAQVRQTGTSLEWINAASLLIHQNCSTAIEASMLGVEPLSVEWFNTPALRLQAATSVSRPAASWDDLVVLVERGLAVGLPPPSEQVSEARQRILTDLYTAIDGESSRRVAEATLETITAARHRGSRQSILSRPTLRGLAAGAVRRGLGYKAGAALRRSYGSVEAERRRAGKAFTRDMVDVVLRRIDTAAADGRRFGAKEGASKSWLRARELSGRSLQLVEMI